MHFSVAFRARPAALSPCAPVSQPRGKGRAEGVPGGVGLGLGREGLGFGC